jgi:alpha/beta superfamily hydrolase
MAPNETLFFEGPAGRIEALLMNPAGPPVAVGIVCHAHPLHGGMMHFKAVFRAAKALQGRGVATLRFNFRGVGLSEGAHDDGRGEQDDVRAAVDEMVRRFPALPLVLGGFSFGAVMALAAGLRDPRVQALFALGYPSTLQPDLSFLSGCTRPCLFVQGERDAFGPGETLRAGVTALGLPKASVAVIAGSDHFFTAHLKKLEAMLSDWAASRPWTG